MTNTSVNRIFALPTSLVGNRLRTVGYCYRSHSIYVRPENDLTIEIWKCNLLVPSSWQKIISLPFREVLFATSALSADTSTIGILAICISSDNNASCDDDIAPTIRLYRINTTNPVDYTCHVLDASSSADFDRDVFLDNILIGHSSTTGWYMYDRSVVVGAIPFWCITLHDAGGTFTIVDRRVPSPTVDAHTYHKRYAILIDGARRKFAKFQDNHRMAVFDESTDEWISYAMSDRAALLDDQVLHVRGVAETYGRRGHRMGAVESPLTIFADDADHCIAKVYAHGAHALYRLQFDHDARTIELIPAALVRLSHASDRRFYPIVTPNELVLISTHLLTIIPYCRPPTLQHACMWTLEKMCGSEDANGAWSGGISEQRVKELCGYKGVGGFI